MGRWQTGMTSFGLKRQHAQSDSVLAYTTDTQICRPRSDVFLTLKRNSGAPRAGTWWPCELLGHQTEMAEEEEEAAAATLICPVAITLLHTLHVGLQ